MKTFIYTIILFITLSTFSQDSNLAPFIGTWEWENGNQTFRLTLYEITTIYGFNAVNGDYKLVEMNNDIETEIYTSNRWIPTWNDYYQNTIYGHSETGEILAGEIQDITYPDYSIKSGGLSLTILSSCIGCPTTAQWSVSKQSPLMFGDNPPDEFNIPTEIILTKVD